MEFIIFSFTGVAEFYDTVTQIISSFNLSVELHLNGGQMGAVQVLDGNIDANQKSPLALQSTLNLKKVWLQILIAN